MRIIMKFKPYNANPSLQLIEAFQQVNVATYAISVFYRLASVMFDPYIQSISKESVVAHAKEVQDLFNKSQSLWRDTLASLHQDDLVKVQRAVPTAQALKQDTEKALRLLFEVYMIHVWNEKEGERPFRDENGAIVSGFASWGPQPADFEDYFLGPTSIRPDDISW
jgi:hypothetical protein